MTRPAPTDAAVLRAVETHRATGSPVRGYRSRKGREWPGYSPMVTRTVPTFRPTRREVWPTAVGVAWLRPPTTLVEARTMGAFDVNSAAIARRLIRDARMRQSTTARELERVERLTRHYWQDV